jgi:hypothetical protein
MLPDLNKFKYFFTFSSMFFVSPPQSLSFQLLRDLFSDEFFREANVRYYAQYFQAHFLKFPKLCIKLLLM